MFLVLGLVKSSERAAAESSGPGSEAWVPKTKTVENYDFPVAQTKIFISAASMYFYFSR